MASRRGFQRPKMAGRGISGFGSSPCGETSGVSEAILKHARKSGVLNLSNRGLSEIPGTVWNLNTEIPESSRNPSFDTEDRWWEQVDLEKLILASNQLKEISPEIKNFPALVVLDAHDNVLEGLPEELGHLSNLKKLALSHNKLTTLPNSLRDLHNLISLHLEHNNLKELCEGIGELRNLEELDLSNNHLVELPSSMTQLKKLLHLNLAHNKLSKLPDGLGELSSLRDLDVQNNQLTEIYQDFSQLKALSRLDFKHNQLSNFPVLPNCAALKELYVGNNRIKELRPEDLQPLVGLSVLDLRDNNISNIPEGIIVLEALERLDLCNNNISSLPNKMGLMLNLKALLLDGNPLRSIRRDIVQRGTQAILKYLKSRITDDELTTAQPEEKPLTKEESVDKHLIAKTKTLELSDMKTSEVSEEVWSAAEAADITSMNLSKNSLTAFPDRLFSYSGTLKEINLGFNKIPSIPAQFSSFTKVTFLDLRNNQLSDLPSSLASLKYLREIIMAYNRFSQIPPVLYEIKSMETIIASDNQIGAIDVPGLLKLPVLAILDLQNNDIRQVPPELGNVTSLRSLQLSGNPFRSPRASIMMKTTQELLEWLRDRIPR